MPQHTGLEATTRWLNVGLTAAIVLLIAGCAKRESAELEWARAALLRNPNIEIVATDAQAGVFTLRDKDNGMVRTVGLQELAAAPASELIRKPVPAPATAPELATPETAPPSARVAQQPSPSSEPAAATEPATPNPEDKGYTIERTDGQLKVSGPGISVVSAGTAATTSQDGQKQRNVDPIICEGRRMMHFDNRNIYVDGDAIIARGGCELYVTNSRVVASGTGIVAHDAVVHIANSQIEGSTASFNAGSGSKLFVRGSTFQGVSRRDEHASVQDQGGNQWR